MRPHQNPDPDEQFYALLESFDRFEEVADPRSYATVPASWWVLVFDIRGSTRAIEAGRYKEVNSLGVSGIVAVVNAMQDLELPYAFGGDGATVLVPAARREDALRAASHVLALARDVFGMELSAGMVPVAALDAAGAPVRVARFRISPLAVLAMFDGPGVALVERWVKDPSEGTKWSIPAAPAADPEVFNGFQCRWSPIRSRRGRVVSLLVQALDGGAPGRGAREPYRQILSGIAAAVGRALEDLCPIEPGRLELAAGWDSLRADAGVRTGKATGWSHALERAKTWVGLRIAGVLFRTGWKLAGFDGASYRREVVMNTDHRKFDGMLRMVLDLDLTECARLRDHLEAGRQAGTLAYGMRESEAALMTCFIRGYSGGHLHFLDGADGGYALAARQLKAQLGEARSRGGAGTTVNS